MNFTWDNLAAAKNRLNNIYSAAEMRWQADESTPEFDFGTPKEELLKAMKEDLNTPKAMEIISTITNVVSNGVNTQNVDNFIDFWKTTDELFGLKILDSTPDIDSELKTKIEKRAKTRIDGDFGASDVLRKELNSLGLSINDANDKQNWFRTRSST
jgi:cysteinyl-tRNA synthetase